MTLVPRRSLLLARFSTLSSPKSQGKTKVPPSLPYITTRTPGHRKVAVPLSHLPPNGRKNTKQLLNILLKNKPIHAEDISNKDFKKPRHNTKRGRDLCDKVLEGLLVPERYKLKNSAAIPYLKLLRRKADDY